MIPPFETSQSQGFFPLSMKQKSTASAIILPGALFSWEFNEQSGAVVNNTVNPVVASNNSLSAGERGFQIPILWAITSGSVTVTDNFALGPDGVNTSATRMLAGGATAAIRGGTSGAGSTFSMPAGNVTLSAWMKLNTGSSATITPDLIGPNATGTWSVTSSWQRFTFTSTTVVPTTAIQFFLPANTDLLVYGVQIEQAASASSYVVPTLNLYFGQGGLGGTDFPTWSGNGTLTTTNAQRALAISDSDLTLTTCTAYIALKSTGTTPQQYGRSLGLANATASGVPQKFEFQTSFWNAPAADTGLLDGGKRDYDPFVGFGGLSKEFPSGNLYDQKWHICAVTCDGTDVHLYIDGILVDSPVASPVSGTPASATAGVFSLGTIGSSFGFPGQHAYVSLYANTVHTYAQIKRNTTAIATSMGSKGLSPVLGVQPGLLVFEGDSITDGIGSGNTDHAALCGNGYGITWVNYGHSGDQTAQLVSRAASLDALIDTTKAYNILVLLIGRNDLDHKTAVQFEADLLAYWQARVAAGWTLIACTLLPTTGATAGPLVPTVNTWIRANYAGAGCAGLADFGGDATILANYTSTSYLFDGTHPTALTYTIMAPYIQTAINGLPAHP
jgi:lysophospholipase L1-like esterase